MTRLFGRSYELVVDTLRITELDITFDVERSLRRTPNKAEIRIYNLSADSRAQIEGLDKVPVRLAVGYRGELSTIFIGRLREAVTERDGVDRVTILRGVDRPPAHGRVRTTLAAGVPLGHAFQQIVGEAVEVVDRELGEGTVPDFLRRGGQVLQRRLSEGVVVDGPVEQEIENVARRAGAEVSIQNGQLQVLPLGSAIDGTAVRLAPDTGLIGSPQIAVKGKQKGTITVEALLIPDLVPGRRIQLESERLTGIFRARKVRYHGETAGGDWYASVTIEDEAKAARRRASRRRPHPETEDRQPRAKNLTGGA